jgi:hypothetical protein
MSDPAKLPLVATAPDSAPLRVFYEDTRQAIAKAVTVNEVHNILALATGLVAAARAASNRDVEAEAAALKLEAERRLGQLIAAQRETVGLNTGTAGQGRPTALGGIPDTPPKKDDRPTLAEAGIDKNLAKRARRAAALAEPEFKTALEVTREDVRAGSRRKPRAVTAARDDIGAASAGELGRLTARSDELQREKRRLEFLNIALNSEVDDLKAELSRVRGENTALRSEVHELKVQLRSERVEDADVHDLLHEVFDFCCGFELRTKGWKRKGQFSTEDKQQLVSAIHQTANTLTLLAQDVDGVSDAIVCEHAKAPTPPPGNDLDIPDFLRRAPATEIAQGGAGA